MPAVLLGIGLLVGFLLIAWAFSRADSRQIAGAFKVVGLIVGVALLLYLLFIGRAALAGLVPILGVLAWRLGPSLFARWQARRQGRAYGRQSGVRTAFLAMTLDHVTGEAEGEVLSGRFAGRSLRDLNLPELRVLWDELATDAQSLALLEAWLDRVHPDWREAPDAEQQQGGRQAGGRRGESMTAEEAYSVLGLSPGASEEDIRTAHRRLMLKLHPDQGGSNWLAAKLNQAKDLLLSMRNNLHP